ncbi:hypothetical protein [Burkholderia multivorans]|uniref:hypothetical protein n=1 Tax=Burkholderia multivorans TaxID=87883 RepID=UPI0012FD118E|nr:hypothetical protein [Burkholderia multivorans]MBU9472077.1 hypothetical protein [Burkholderia multivorans]
MIRITLNPNQQDFCTKIKLNPAFMNKIGMQFYSGEDSGTPYTLASHFIVFDTQEEADQFKSEYPEFCIEEQSPGEQQSK